RVEIEQHSDKLRFRVSMNATIALARIPAHCNHRRATSQVNRKLLFDGRAKFIAFKFFYQTPERRAALQLLKWKAAARVNFWKVFCYFAQKLFVQEIIYHQKGERRFVQRRVAQR